MTDLDETFTEISHGCCFKPTFTEASDVCCLKPYPIIPNQNHYKPNQTIPNQANTKSSLKQPK